MMQRMLRVLQSACVAGMLLAGMLLARNALAQEQPAPTSSSSAPSGNLAAPSGNVPDIKVDVRLVNVFVNVSDQSGAPVAGLTRDDFLLSEDGKPQKIAVFERESGVPLSIVLAVDTSGSVHRDMRLEVRAAKDFVHSMLRPQDEIELLEFDENVRERVPFTSNPRSIDNGLDRMERGSATALYNAIYLASQSLAARPGTSPRRKVIVLVTDGDNTVRGMRYPQAVEQAQRAEAMVYSLIIVPVMADAGRDTGGEHALIQMSRDTGGKYYYVEEPRDLERSFEQVSEDLRTEYLLGYYPSTRDTDGSFRTIDVQMKDPALAAKYTLHHRIGYYPDGQ